MTGPRAYVAINWERAADGALSPYLTIARHDQPVERIPLTRQDVARIVADGAYLWSVVDPGWWGSMQNLHNARQPDHIGGVNKMVAPDRSAASVAADDTPHFIGVFGE